jgi:exonuclease III
MTGEIGMSGKIDHILFLADLADLAEDIKQVEIDHEAEGSAHRPVWCWLKKRVPLKMSL